MKGIFFGIVFFALCIVGVIIFFILSGSDDCDSQKMGFMVNDTFESIMISIMIVVTCWVGTLSDSV